MNDMTRPDDVDPPYDCPEYRSTHLRAPKEKLLELPADFYDRPGPFVPAGLHPRRRHRPHHSWPGRAPGRAHGGFGPRARRRRPSGAPRAGRALAGQCVGALPPPRRYARRAARPQLPRHGPHAHRRRRALPVHHRETRRLPVAQPPVRMAPGAPPFLAPRQRARAAPHHADVFPRRSAARARPGVQQRAGQGGARAHDLRALARRRHRGRRAGIPLRHRAGGSESTPFGM
jgi:hypothetical protein